MSAGIGDAQSAADSASHPLAATPSCASPHKGLDLVRCVGDLGHAVSTTDGKLRVCSGGGWGGAPLLAVLHRKPPIVANQQLSGGEKAWGHWQACTA